MEWMKTIPDNYYDLAVVDAPYGDANGSSQNVQVERERERAERQRITDLEVPDHDLKSTSVTRTA